MVRERCAQAEGGERWPIECGVEGKERHRRHFGRDDETLDAAVDHGGLSAVASSLPPYLLHCRACELLSVNRRRIERVGEGTQAIPIRGTAGHQAN